MKEIEDSKGFLKEHYSQFRLGLKDGLINSFKGLIKDEDRFEFVKGLVLKGFPLQMREAAKSGKNLSAALNFKEEGNKAFQKGDDLKALVLYNQSIFTYPLDEDNTELSIIRANRSATLYHMEEFELALIDIETSVSLGYPKHLLHKIYDRKARCLLALGQNVQGFAALRATLVALDDAKIPIERRQKWQRDIQITTSIMSKNKTADEKMAPTTIKSAMKAKRHAVYKAASEDVEINQSDSLGRYAVAANDLPSGEVILREKPACAVLLQENSSTHCFVCLKRVLSGEPCPTCTLVKFCSSNCQKVALATHHKYECSILPTVWASGASITCLMALRLITQRPLKYWLRVHTELKETDDWKGKEYSSSDYTTVYNLVRHEKKRSVEDMIHRTYMAVFLHWCLSQTNYFSLNDLKAEDIKIGEKLTGGLILRHLQFLQFNAHEISELLIQGDPDKWKSKFLGGGLYPTLALFNHSCEPGIVRYFEGNKVVVRTIKSVKKGEMLAENYGPIFTETPKKERQKTLKQQYWFDCACPPCQLDWVMLDQMDPHILRFPCENSECSRVIDVPSTTMTFMIQCTDCGQQNNILKGLKVLQDSESIFRLGQTYLKELDIERATSKFLELQSLLGDTLAPPFRDFYLCQQNLKSCFVAQGNTSPSLHKIKSSRNKLANSKGI